MKEKQKETQGSIFFYEWTCRTSSRGKKKTQDSYFWPESSWQMARTFQFPVTLFLTLLSSIVWHWHGAQQHTQPLLQDTSGLTSRCVVEASRANLPRMQLQAHSKERLCTSEEKRRLKRDLSRSVKGRNLFSSPSPSALFCREGNLRRCVEGEAGGSYHAWKSLRPPSQLF